jgi:hypothetical protein
MRAPGTPIRIDWLPLGSVVALMGEMLPRMVVARMVGNSRDGIIHEYVGCISASPSHFSAVGC